MRAVRVAVCLLCVAQARQLYEDSGYDAADETYADEAHAERIDDDEGPGLLERSAHLRDLLGRLQRSLDADGLLRARRWSNVANGALLAATGPVVLTVSVFGLKLSNVVLSLYVTAFGGLLAGVELGLAPIAPWVRSNLSYLMTTHGRTALLAFLGGLTWPLGKLGVVPALLTCVNAVFNAHFQQLLAFVSEDDGVTGAGEAVKPAQQAGDMEGMRGGVDAAHFATQATADSTDFAQAEILEAMAAARSRSAAMRAPEAHAQATDEESIEESSPSLEKLKEALEAAQHNGDEGDTHAEGLS